ncbi:hypothetical protein P3T36_004405 [Kitasatospora sp. MAP12-15]|uniref:hypothetical protein n=1 Tax=unclassified Kitasatospora TaxID=2633591 RepID=UPI0024745795|nr:hypothetical protein [Kitasatospora sp. MAP12-44]MDH6110831.1 hypothetical protein [Kitasatospora sp. MAP12-44]
MEPRRDPRPSDLKTDLDAALQTRKELGAEYESELVDSFLSRIDARLDARVEQQVAERMGQYAPNPYEQARPGRRERHGGRGWGGLPALSLMLAIPLTGIASAAGIVGMLSCWAGIVGVNFAAAHGERREQQKRAQAPRSEWA